MTINAPVARVFDYVNDWANATEFTHDLLRWEPLSDQTKGLGAKFQAAMKMGPTRQESTLEITQCERNAVIGWEPRAGFSQRGKYVFRGTGNTSEVTFEVAFDPPGGIAGRLLGKTIEPVVRQNVAKTLDNLKRKVEAKAAPCGR